MLSSAIKPVPHGSKFVYLAFGTQCHDLLGFITSNAIQCF